MFRMTVEGYTNMQGRGIVISGAAEGACRPGDRLVVEGSAPPRLFTVQGVATPKPGVNAILIDLEEPREARQLVGKSLLLLREQGTV